MSKDTVSALDNTVPGTSIRRVGTLAKWLVAGAVLTGISGVAMARTDLNIGVNLGGPVVAQPVYYGPPPPRYYGPPPPPPHWHRHYWRDRWGHEHWGPPGPGWR